MRSLLVALVFPIGLHPKPAFSQDPLRPNGFDDLTEPMPPSPDDDEGDLVESIFPSEGGGAEKVESGDASSSGDLGGGQDFSGSTTRTQASGYVRQSFELVFGELSRQTGDQGPATLWRDVFSSRTQLVVRASHLARRSFEATVSGMLGYTLHVAEEPPLYSRPGPVDLSRGEIDATLREAYLGFYWSAIDLRIGQQRIAWGRSDFQSPNDVLNARDLRDPVLAETELTRLPTPALRSSVTGGAVTVEVVVSPVFVPDQFDVYGSNWSVVQPRASDEYEQFLGSVSLLADQSVERDLAALWRQSQLPLDNGKGASAGARLSASFGGVDLSAYYHYGYDRTPFVRLDPAFQAYLRRPDTDLSSGNPAELAPLLDFIGEGREIISSRYLRRHHAGFDFATAVGPLILRADAAYQTRRVYYRLDLNSFATPAALGVLGLEYQTGRLGDILLVELMGERLMDPSPLPLIGYRRTTASVVGTVRWTLAKSWGVDLRAYVGLRPEAYVLRPALRYMPSDSFSLYLGALVVSGSPYSLGWYYADNDSAFVQLRYAF